MNNPKIGETMQKKVLIWGASFALLSFLLASCGGYTYTADSPVQRVKSKNRLYLKPGSTKAEENQARSECAAWSEQYDWLGRKPGTGGSGAVGGLYNKCMRTKGFLNKLYHKKYDASLILPTDYEIEIPRYWAKAGTTVEDETLTTRACFYWVLRFSNKVLFPRNNAIEFFLDDKIYNQAQDDKFDECMRAQGFEEVNEEGAP